MTSKNNFFKKNNHFVVAEVGNNHEGSFANAKKLIEEAAKTGVDAVKFQAYNVDKFISKNVDKERYNRLKGFQLSKDQFAKLRIIAKKNGLIFFATPFDLDYCDFLNKIQPIFKVSSGDNNHFSMIDRILSFNKPLIISTGLLNILQIEKLYNYIKKKKYSNELVLMHCVSSYPTSYKDVNLSAIQYMIKKFKNCLIGYSDHTIGIECCVYASCLGAKVIEKHFTLDKNFSDFRDHQISADPQEMISLVKKIRSIKTILGNEKKFVTKNELLNIRNLRRSICASRDLKKGKILNSSDFEYLRPQLGMSADKYHQLIGKKISKNINIGDFVR
jgi:sialic acid synthase SpsE